MNVTNGAKIPLAVASLTLGLLASIPGCSLVFAQAVRVDDSSDSNVCISVLGLFHPHQFTLTAPESFALVLHAGEERVVLEKSSGVDSASVGISHGNVVVTAGTRVLRVPKLTVSGRKNEPVDFILGVPEKIVRRYHGTLEIKPAAGILIAIVAMDRETALASVVAAESAPETPLEALKAQAIAARSYLVASRGRHRNFDFCDTTHCQFLRQSPAPGSAVSRAVAATRDLVLAYDSHPFAAMYTRSCSGHTRTPTELGLASSTYPYYSVECEYCRTHPVRWSSRISAADAATLRASDEASRLKMDRRLGWDTVSSNDFVAKIESHQIILEGIGHGHGIGLCQSGASALAKAGADFRQILSHYYPNTTIVNWLPVSVGPMRSGQTAHALDRHLP
jgi:stage II sporulation protein D